MGLIVPPKFQSIKVTGMPLAGGQLYTYQPGTTTPKTTYSDAGLTTPNANPVELDARGEASIHGSGTYKFVLKDSDDNTIWTEDNIDVVGATYIQDADSDTKIQTEETSDEDKIRFDCAGEEQLILEDGTFYPSTDNDLDFGKVTKAIKKACINKFDIEGTYEALMPSNGVAAHAVFMLGNSDTIAWFYLNAAPPGWKISTVGGDSLLAVAATSYKSSGTADGTTANKLIDSGATFQTDNVAVDDLVYNTTDDTSSVVTAVDSETQLTLADDIFVSGEGYRVGGYCSEGGKQMADWDWPDYTLLEADVPAHTHGSEGAHTHDDAMYQAVAGGSTSNAVSGDGAAGGTLTVDSDGAHTHASFGGGGGHSHGGDEWHPKASVGKLFQLDTA